jgi:cyclic pyranopterin phosphate synthase
MSELRGAALSHVDGRGEAHMVDVGAKAATDRTARATGAIRMSADAYALVAANGLRKGDVLAVARVAGVMAAKRTAELIPLCHQIVLTHADVACTLDPALPGVRVEATARTVGPTGVEMEALTATSVALLTVYDMVKAADAAMEIGAIRLLDKTGGSGWDAAPKTVRDLHRAGPPMESAGTGDGPAPAMADDVSAPSGAARRSDTPPNPTEHA